MGWLLSFPQSDCTGPGVTGGTDTLQCIEQLPMHFCTCACGSMRNSGETCGKISEENQNAKRWMFLSFLISFFFLWLF